MNDSPTIQRAMRIHRGRLLCGASLIALVTALGIRQAVAQSMAQLRAVTGVATAAAISNAANQQTQGSNLTAGMSAAAQRALAYQNQVNQSLSLAMQAQSAARAAAQALNPGVPDGLGLGGLNPVANPVPAAQDPTGLNTWDGASAPTQTTSDGKVQVTIDQTQSRAILSWDTFNIGANTTLTFNQKQNGVAQPGWVALNRVVGQLDPTTGLRNPNTAPAPSQILGSLKADGTVLVLNQNGILFGGTAQVNVHSLVATSLEIGRALDNGITPLSIKDRDNEFLTYGLLGFADQASANQLPSAFTFSAQALDAANYDPLLEGKIEVDAGADIATDTGGFILLTGPKVVNSGQLTAPQGQVSLQSGREITLQRSTGAADSINPDVRGFVVTAINRDDAAGNYVENDGIIQSTEGFISLASTDNGGVINQGILEASTSVSRNGFIQLSGGDIQLGAGSTIAIGPEDSKETIPQDPTSLQDFKPSKVDIGSTQSRIEMDQNAMIYAPSGDVTIGADAGPIDNLDNLAPGTSRIFIDTGAIIDVAGLTDVQIAASRNEILIRPVTANELQDAPDYKNGFLNGAAVYVDPRLSGVRADGVAWVGSPLIPAESFAEQVGVTAQELMTTGGNVTLGVSSFAQRSDTSQVPDVTVKAGATIDLSGGWVAYQAGMVQTTQLVDAGGEVVDISNADPNDTFIGIYNGFVASQPRWGIEQTFNNPLFSGTQYEAAYSEGRDAGSLTIKASSVVLDGSVFANAYAGPLQIADAHPGTAHSTVYGDLRNLQGAPSQLPSGGMLFAQALGTDPSGNIAGGGDIAIVNQADYQPVSSDLGYGQSISLDADGNLLVPVRDPASLLPPERIDTITLSADALSNMGLSEISLATSGKIDVAQNASVDLDPGGVFNAQAGRTITIDGVVSAPSGTIALQTVDVGFGSVFLPDTAQLGSFDIVVNGTLSTRGRWVNDFNVPLDQVLGSAYLNGGSISLSVAPRVTLDPGTATVTDTRKGNAPMQTQDISGSILVNSGALLDVSGGGYVAPNGSLNLSSKGGNLSLINETTYFQLTDDPNKSPGGIPGFRVTTIDNTGSTAYVPVNPDTINARVAIADGTILANGFAGGGTFTLTTPQFDFGDGIAATGTELPMDFFSKAGFANYNITSYKTDLIANAFDNGLGGCNAVLATQTLTVGAGETLSLTQSMFSPLVDGAQTAALRGLQTGGDLYSVLTPSVPTDEWDRKAVNLSLGGLIELNVSQGGQILGEAGGTLAVAKLDNEGTIRIPGGTIVQAEILPSLYVSNTTIAAGDLSQIFIENSDGTITENAPNALGIVDPAHPNKLLSNAQLIATHSIYLLGDLGADEGVYLAPGSVTDLSGESIRNPRAKALSQNNFAEVINGRVIDGGTLETLGALQETTPLFHQTIGVSIYKNQDPTGIRAAERLVAAPDSTIDLSGASDVYDQLGTGGAYGPAPVWSNGGTLMLGNGGTITGADIHANGGASAALGGTLVALDPVLTQIDPDAPAQNIISAAMISDAGFDTLVAEGSITSLGDVTVDLGRGFFLTSRPFGGLAGQDLNNTTVRDSFAPVIRSGGALEIDAPYISFASDFHSVSTPNVGTPGDNSAIFRADQIDIAGAVVVDQSVGDVQFDAAGDVRLIGVEPWQQNLNINAQTVPNSLSGQLAVNGDLTITAGQIYPTTGSSFYLTSSAADGMITFAKSDGPTPTTPYSAGGNLLVQAANIVQGGVIRVPLGSLTLGSNTPLMLTTDSATAQFAPATQSVHLLDGSITSVSANGLVIPYGTTTDQNEWFFAPTGSNQLTAPPTAILHLGGTDVAMDFGATVDVSGGGDLYAYEFIPGTGGSHDVLSQFNTDAFSSNNGLQYPDGRQVYAIVPGLSNVTGAAYDPIYSSNYSNLYSASAAGKSVYLSAAPGLAAGWYTLLPAQYALLPGGMRVVEQTGAAPVAPDADGRLSDGTFVVAGYYGTAGTGAYESTIRTFDVQSQTVFLKYSDIALTSANQKFDAVAASNGVVPPRLPVDAGRLVLDPAQTLEINTVLTTTPGQGGRGAEADISGKLFDIVSTLPDTLPADGAIVLAADSLTNLNASSLLIGGTRTDNADGTTSLNVTAQSILVENDSTHPLTGSEMVFAVDGSGAGITLADGATILASGTADDNRSGDYIIDGSLGSMTGQGAVLRVGVGPQRQVTRLNPDAGALTGLLSVGAVNLQGASVLLDSSGDLTVAPNATITADALALGVDKVTFTSDGTGLSGLVVTPTLQALFAQAKQLSIRTPTTIDFSSGTYQFADLQLDTPGLAVLDDGGAVTLKTGVLTLANGTADAGACDAAGAPACGTGNLAIDASEIDFGSGTLHTYGFGGNVMLTATGGMFIQGTGVFDAGPAELDLETPFLGDRALALAPGQDALLPSLSLTTTGAVNISNPTSAATPTVAGTPGAVLSISGQSVSIADSELRATAGTLSINSATGIDVSGKAMIETPGYSRTLGDSADPVTVFAPGGALKLTALDGNIDLGTGTTLSVGGGTGNAGTLNLSASKGTVNFGGTLDANAPGGGGSFILDTGSAFDLSTFDAGTGKKFTGNIAIHTGSGDLVLASGDTLSAANVSLTADGGLVDIGGTINVSGTNGGEVDLFGMDGVKLESTALIDAHANGYAATDTRQASGGKVNIGTDGTGAITVASGATIDVSARRADGRLVPMIHNGVTYYTYVEADQGGTVDFRAPVIDGASGETVNVSYAGTIDGARSIVLEGFKRFDLAQVAADPDFTGVSINAQGQAVLDTGASAAGEVNFLSDNAPGTVVQFVQDFDISSSYGNLGGLASQANFHAQPGMELDYSGDIVLASNWNLGAGTVDVAGAVAAGLMALVPSLPGQYYVLPGEEAAVFERFTKLTYRTGGAVDGEPGSLTLRAGGNLDIQGSITDGFFQFRDQTDPGYLNLALGGGNQIYSPWIGPNCLGGSCNNIGEWQTADALPGSYVLIGIPSASSLQGLLQNPAPYSAIANSAAALGSLPGGTGDPLGSAQLFPLLNGTQAVDSWSYNLVGGADLASVDPTRTLPGATGNVIVEGTHPYTYVAVKGTSVFNDTLLMRAGTQFVTADQWYQAFVNLNPTLDPSSFTLINFTTAPADVKTFLTSAAASFFAQYPGQYQLVGPEGAPTGVTTTLAIASKFMTDVVAANIATLQSSYKPPKASAVTKPTTATSQTLVRTGTGNINVAAAGDIDLRNGVDPVYEKITGAVATQAQGGLQLGGTAIYTAGHLADTTPRTVIDELTGRSFTIDPSAYDTSTDIFATPPPSGYEYGAGGTPDLRGIGFTGILLANPAYADGGGDVSLNAGQDILGRRDIWQESRLATYYDIASSYGYSWIGAADQPWRTGAIGDVTNALIDPQLFSEGVGALGGGNLSVKAGRDVSDLSIISDTSITTADVSSNSSSLTQALWTFGGGNVTVNAGRDLLGGRIDVASGNAIVVAGRDVASAGQVQISGNGAVAQNELRLRVTDATIAVEAAREVEIEGIAALGIQHASSQVQNNLNARGFYSADSGVSILADSTIIVDNHGADVVTPNEGATAFTSSAVYPGSFEAASLTGDLDLVTAPATFNTADAIILFPSPNGQLNLFAAGDISPVTLAMEDGDPGLLPGVFSTFTADQNDGVLSGRTFLFPGVLPNTPQVVRASLHNADITHLGDPNPVRTDAGGDIVGMILSVPKQARVSAGRDIINMMFFGQNVSANDITRVVAGRDIIGTTKLVQPLIALPNVFGAPLAALQGNAFVLGGPGSFFLEAGRNAGPFLNSANTNGFQNVVATTGPDGPQSYGGGILSLGNEWNPWLPANGASLYVEFGVGKGADYDGFRNYYLDPANLANLDGSLFVQVKDASGNLVPDRTQPIYAPVLIKWLQANAAAELVAAYGSTNVTYDQAYTVFAALPELQQRVFILDNVYFNELTQTSIPDGPSYKQYSRGYRTVNTLFPATLGYTQNDLSGGGNGANTLVQTGDLDLRLAAIETTRGGNIYILGPGGRVLAGSTVATADQAARRAYDGGRLFSGNVNTEPLAAAITSIPAGFEGILTLRGGSIDTFTDADFLLNQSRLFTESGGDIAMWSSNGNLNAGQGPKTSADFPPIVLQIDEDLFAQVDSVGGVTGAGIAAFEPDPNATPSDVFLIAPRGTVDAGAAGVRVSGNLFIAALTVANAANFSVGGTSFGIPAAATVAIGAQTSAGSASAAAAQAAEAVASAARSSQNDASVITVDVLGYAGDENSEDDKRRKKKK